MPVPSPSAPYLFSPQQYAVPLVVTPQVRRPPAHKDANWSPAGDGHGRAFIGGRAITELAPAVEAPTVGFAAGCEAAHVIPASAHRGEGMPRP